MLNTLTLIGNVGKDVNDYGKVAKFSLATNRSWKDRDGNWQDETQWHNITCFGFMKEYATRNIQKGAQVLVIGRVEYGSYQKDGNTVYTTDIIAEKLRTLGKRETSGNSANRWQGRDDAPNTGDDVPF